MKDAIQAVLLMLTILACWKSHASVETELASELASAERSSGFSSSAPVQLIVRPSVQLSPSAGLRRELSLAEIVDLKAVRESDRAEIERHLMRVVLTDRPAIGEERSFTQEGLEPIVAEAQRRLAAAGFTSEWKIPTRSRVFRVASFNSSQIESVIKQELQKKCDDCEIQIRSLNIPSELKMLGQLKSLGSEATVVRDWFVESRNERPRGSFAWPLQLELSNGTRQSHMITGLVEYFRNVPVATRMIQGGEKITPTDFRIERRSVSFVMDEPATPLEIASGVASRALSAGDPLWKSNLRKEQVIRYGDAVRVQIGDEAFTVTSEGVALSAAAVGEMIQVRVGKMKKQVSGVVKEKGLVEIR